MFSGGFNIGSIILLKAFCRGIPYIFNGMYGYNHFRTKEVNGGVVIAFAMITVFSDFKERAIELAKRLEL